MSLVLPEIQANEMMMRVCYWPEPIISAGRKKSICDKNYNEVTGIRI